MRASQVADELRRRGIEVSVDDFLQAVVDGIQQVPAHAESATEGEIAVLREHGGPTAAKALAAPDGLTRAAKALSLIAARTASSVIADSDDVPTVAARLGLDRTAIIRRIQRQALWSFDLDGRHRIPRWQFVDSQPLPHLSMVIPAIPHGAAPATVNALMHAPQEELDGRTPVEHLAAGGSPEPVAAMVAELDQW